MKDIRYECGNGPNLSRVGWQFERPTLWLCRGHIVQEIMEQGEHLCGSGPRIGQIQVLATLLPEDGAELFYVSFRKPKSETLVWFRMVGHALSMTDNTLRV